MQPCNEVRSANMIIEYYKAKEVTQCKAFDCSPPQFPVVSSGNLTYFMNTIRTGNINATVNNKATDFTAAILWYRAVHGIDHQEIICIRIPASQ